MPNMEHMLDTVQTQKLNKMTNAKSNLELTLFSRILIAMTSTFTFLYGITSFVQGTFILGHDARLGIAVIWVILNLIINICLALDYEDKLKTKK